MELIDRILSDGNIEAAIHAVKSNRGAAGIDRMTVDALEGYFAMHGEEIKEQIRAKKYKPQPVRRVYIPKANGKQRPLGIPTVVDRVIQQAVAQVLSRVYEPYFSDHSYGFRPNRDCHEAIGRVLEYLNEGYEWVVDLDIEKYFDTVNHDKLISILREHVNEAKVLDLIRSFLRAGVMEDGLVSPTEEGVPQGGPLSPVLSNIYLDKLDKELECRGLGFVRYADDCDIFVRSEKAADRVMASVSSWLERKLRLKVSASKTKVVRPTKSTFLGFNFWKSTEGWKPRPAKDRKAKLCEKVKTVLCRKRAAAMPLGAVFTKLNQILRGWINYFRIGSMKGVAERRFRPVDAAQGESSDTQTVEEAEDDLQKSDVAEHQNALQHDTRGHLQSGKFPLGAVPEGGAQCGELPVGAKVLSLPNKKENRPGLVDPLAYYLGNT